MRIDRHAHARSRSAVPSPRLARHFPRPSPLPRVLRDATLAALLATAALLGTAPAYAQVDTEPGADEPAADADETTDVDVTSAPRRSAPASPRRGQPTPSSEELPEGASFGAPNAVEATAWREQQERRRIDPTEPGRLVALQLFIGLAAGLDSSLDAALVSHGYGESALIVTGDVAVLARATSWLYLGARIGGRGRGWNSNDVAPAVAGGLDALALAHLRVYAGPFLDLGASLGGGVGWASLTVENTATSFAAPRLHGSAVVGFRLAEGVRLCARVGYDWFPVFDLDRFGHDLDLGGPTVALGLEVRG